MTLINEPASFPSHRYGLWSRFLLSVGGQYPAERARAMLCPPSLLPEETRAKDETFNRAVRTLQDLGLVTVDGDDLSLAPVARSCPGDLDGFADLLRRAVLEPDRNTGLTEKRRSDRAERPGPRAGLVPHSGRVHSAWPG